MKKTLTLVSVALVALIMSSCVESSEKYQTLLAEKEAIAAEKATMESQYNAAFGIINDVENNLQAIRDAHVSVRLEAIDAAKNNDFKEAVPYMIYRIEKDKEE